MTRDIFDHERLSPALDEFLRKANPWWESKPGRDVPTYHRWVFHRLLNNLKNGLTPGVVLRGPRQVGKTTLQEQMIDHLIRQDGVDPKRIFRVQFDEIPSTRGLLDVVLALARWYENRILKKTFNEAAREGKPAFVFFDEVQNVTDWAPQIKALVDHFTVRVMVTGSSALRIKEGHDSLAGRVSTVELGPLLLREIAGFHFQESLPALLEENGLAALKQAEFWESLKALGLSQREIRDRAFTTFSERGGYPIAQLRADMPWEKLTQYLNETVIQRAIVHDLRKGDKGRKRDPQLLEEVFKLACRYAGQAPGQAIMVQQVHQVLHAEVSWSKIRHYLEFLDSTLLIKLIHPVEIRIKKRKGNNKICLCDPGLRASWLQEKVPLAPEALSQYPDLGDLAGHLAESVAGYFLGSLPGIGVHHFPAREIEPEVDFVLTIGEKRIPVEIKYQNQVRDEDTYGLRAFLEKTVYHATFGILVTRTDDVKIRDPRIIAMPLSTLLLLR